MLLQLVQFCSVFLHLFSLLLLRRFFRQRNGCFETMPRAAYWRFHKFSAYNFCCKRLRIEVVDYDADICVVQTIHYFARCRLRSLVTKALLFNYSEMPKIAYAYMDCCVLHAYNDALKSCRTLQYYVGEWMDFHRSSVLSSRTANALDALYSIARTGTFCICF